MRDTGAAGQLPVTCGPCCIRKTSGPRCASAAGAPRALPATCAAIVNATAPPPESEGASTRVRAWQGALASAKGNGSFRVFLARGSFAIACFVSFWFCQLEGQRDTGHGTRPGQVPRYVCPRGVVESLSLLLGNRSFNQIFARATFGGWGLLRPRPGANADRASTVAGLIRPELAPVLCQWWCTRSRRYAGRPA